MLGPSLQPARIAGGRRRAKSIAHGLPGQAMPPARTLTTGRVGGLRRRRSVRRSNASVQERRSPASAGLLRREGGRPSAGRSRASQTRCWWRCGAVRMTGRPPRRHG